VLTLKTDLSPIPTKERRVVGYSFGPFRVLPTERLLFQDGRPISIMPKVFDTLLVFLRHGGQSLSKDELLRLIWNGSAVEMGNLTQNIFILRKILGEAPHEHRYLVTIPTMGYRFVAKVRKLYDDRTVRVPGANGTGSRFTDAAKLSLAVLPFTPLNPNGGGEHFDEIGIADTLITRLSGLRHVVVRPTNAILKYVGTRPDPLAAGRELLVDAVLSGTIQHSGESIRVNAQLIDTSDGNALWAEQVDEKLSDVFAVQDSVSERILRAFCAEFAAGPEQRGGRGLRRHTEGMMLKASLPKRRAGFE
jgi:TolB-like protein